jgi:hypothetical protein
MDLSMNNFDLFYLSNNIDLKRLRHNTLNKKTQVDMSFYIERIKKQTNDLLSESEMEIDDKIKHAFLNYIRLTIDHLKFIDKRDIIQKDYVNIKVKKEKEINFNLEKTNKLMEKRDREKIGKLTDSLDIKIKYKKEKKMFYPKKKVINLKDDSLRTKGVNKKKI